MWRPPKIARKIVAVYPLGKEALIVRGRRSWYQWSLLPVESYCFEDSESLYETLNKISTTVSDPTNTTVIIFLPRSLYYFSRTIYPKQLEENIEKIMDYDKYDNLFFKNDCFYMPGDFSITDDRIIASLFWIKGSTYEKIHQSLSGERFQQLIILPDVLIIKEGLLKILQPEEATGSFWSFIPSGENFYQIAHIAKGRITESLLLNSKKSLYQNMVISKLEGAERIICLGSRLCEGECSTLERGCPLLEYRLALKSLQFEKIDYKVILEEGTKAFLKSFKIRDFTRYVYVNIPKIPKWVYGIIVLVTLFFLFTAYIFFENNYLEKKLKKLNKRKALLEDQWKPIENQLRVIDQIEKDKKNLADLTEQSGAIKELIEVLSNITPKDTWINNLIITQGNKVILRGESKSAVQYMGELSKVAGFSDVRFISPVRKNPGEEKEFFNIELHVNWPAFKKATRVSEK